MVNIYAEKCANLQNKAGREFLCGVQPVRSVLYKMYQNFSFDRQEEVIIIITRIFESVFAVNLPF